MALEPYEIEKRNPESEKKVDLGNVGTGAGNQTHASRADFLTTIPARRMNPEWYHV